MILLHGGGQTRGAWRRTAEHLAGCGYQAITIDTRGHGDSDWASSQPYSMAMFADDLCRVIEALAGAAPALIGASLGGLTALYALGLPAPPPASALVLVDIATRTKEKGTNAIRDFMLANVDGFASIEAAADAVARYMTDRPRPANVEGLRRNLRERDGRFYWHWDPAFMAGARDADSERGWRVDLDAAARHVTIPTLLVRGEYSEVIDRESIEHTRALIPHLEVVEVPKAGHMVAGDANSPFGAAIMDFLGRVYPA